MANIVRDLPKLTTVTSSGGAAVTNAIGSLDDASSITLFLASSASAATSAAVVQISQFDPAINVQSGVPSTSWFSAGTVTSSGGTVLSNISFRGLRLSFTATSSAAGEIIAFVSKQISV